VGSGSVKGRHHADLRSARLAMAEHDDDAGAVATGTRAVSVDAKGQGPRPCVSAPLELAEFPPGARMAAAMSRPSKESLS
jgi:hypothetical protein